MTYRFHPVVGAPMVGVLTGGEKIAVAEFITPKEAKRRRLDQHRKEELALLNRVHAEAAQREWYPER